MKNACVFKDTHHSIEWLVWNNLTIIITQICFPLNCALVRLLGFSFRWEARTQTPSNTNHNFLVILKRRNGSIYSAVMFQAENLCRELNYWNITQKSGPWSQFKNFGTIDGSIQDFFFFLPLPEILRSPVYIFQNKKPICLMIFKAQP